ncbi:MAG TPA: hypothetical protein EYQ41_00685 [Micavibrio sp.]|nr:hypothetical protein [Micavibrio sp.]|tara:strand:- start:133 stop:492 length:360 start_codon:yes stop_codon:yes gene_type:complete
MNFTKTLTAAAAIAFAASTAHGMTTTTDYDYFCIEAPYDIEMNADETADWITELATLFNSTVSIERSSIDIHGVPHTAFKVEIDDKDETFFLLHSTADNFACEMDQTGYGRALDFTIAP